MGTLLSQLIASSSEDEECSRLQDADVVIDFSHPTATEKYLQSGPLKPLVIGTTGHSLKQLKYIEQAATQVPILLSANFSTGMALCLQAASFFGKELFGKAFIDIIETHHIHKKDAPSGTALSLAKAIDPEFQNLPPEIPRNKDQIHVHSIRSGEVIGEHTVIFEYQGERLILTHSVSSREPFARGALLGAQLLKNKPPKVYSFLELIKNEIT